MFHSRTIKQLIFVAVIISISSFIRCSETTVSDGGGTDVFNATISGKITSPDSSSVENSTVKLIPSDFNPLLDIIKGQSIDTVDSTGNFSVIALDSGYFNLFIRSADNSHVSIIRDMEIGNEDTYILNPTMDSICLQKIILPLDVYGHGAYLGFIGTEIYQGIPNNFDTIEIWLPLDTLPALQIIWPDGTLGDTLLDTFITTDTIIIVEDTNAIQINSSYIPFSGLGSPNEKALKLLNDSLGNVWILFKTGITRLTTLGDEVTESDFYDRSILLLSASNDDINDAGFSPDGNLWVCSNGVGLFKHDIDNSGILSGIQYNKSNSSLITNDTIHTIDFKDSLTLLSQPLGLFYGDHEKDSLFNSITGYLNCHDAVFLSDIGILFISSTLNLYNFNTQLVETYPFDFNSTFNITSFTSLSSTSVYLGTNDAVFSADKKVTFFNSNTNSWNHYNLYVISPTVEIRSSAKDINEDEWFGTENGQIVYLPEQDENKEHVYTDANSAIPSNAFIISNMLVSKANILYATVDTLGIVLFDINSKRRDD